MLMRRAVAVLLAVCLTFSAPPQGSSTSVALAQDVPPMPDLGDTVLADPLKATGPFWPGSCPTGRNVSAFVPEGFRLRVTGRCADTATSASMLMASTGLTIADGDVAVDVS